jgi:ketosteroid isomerase-like protein
MPADAVDAAHAYYRALDDHDYDALSALLTPEFVHDRPDMTIEGRERFVRFMREERPQKHTTHRIAGVYRAVDDRDGVDACAPENDRDREPDDGSAAETTEVVARGRLLAADGDRITDFVDVFSVAAGDLVRIETYAR